MSSVRRRRLAAAPLAVALTLGLAGCGTGFDAQTNQVYQPAVGANARGDVDSLSTLLVANADGSATVSAALQNNLDQDQQLTSVTVSALDGTALDVKAPAEPLELAPDVLVTLGGAETGGVFTIAEGAVAGAYVKVTLSFSDSGPVTVQAPVVARTDEYATVAGGDGLTPEDVSGGGEEAEEAEAE